MVAISLNGDEKPPQVEESEVKVEVPETTETAPCFNKNGLRILVITMTIEAASILVGASFLKELSRIYMPMSKTCQMILVLGWLLWSAGIACFVTMRASCAYFHSPNHFCVGLLKLLMLVIGMNTCFAVVGMLYVAYYSYYWNPVIAASLRPHLYGFLALIPWQFYTGLVWWRIEERMIAKKDHRDINYFGCPKDLCKNLKKLFVK